MVVLDLSIRLLQAALLLCLLFLAVRNGRAALWPWFCIYLGVTAPVSVMWAGAALWSRGYPWSEMGAWSIILGTCAAPLACAATWEAISLRTIFVRLLEAWHGETFYVFYGSACVASVLALLAIYKEPQLNAPSALSRAQLVVEVGLASMLLLAWAYWSLPPRKSPLKASGHLALLMLWFVIFATSHVIPVRPSPQDHSYEELQAVSVAEQLLAGGVTINEVESWESISDIEQRALRQLRSMRLRWYLINDCCGLAACVVLLAWMRLFSRRARSKVGYGVLDFPKPNPNIPG